MPRRARFGRCLAVLLLAVVARPASAEVEFDYFGGLALDADVPAPVETLGHEIGEHFTRHHQLVDYFAALAAGSPRVRLEHYGETNQRRPLFVAVISSPANLERLDEILEHNRALADPRAVDPARLDEIVATNATVVWLSYGVHGNEASAPETAIQVAYTLAAATNDEISDILDNCVVVIDPCLNPDGRQRYISWFENVVGRGPNPAPDAAEHWEPWPGGRTNHYHFDLNRDWLWMTQVEKRQRIPIYRRYLPQLHIDYHEQEYRTPSFGLGDTPFNANIPAETLEWIELYGRANAEVFDREGVVYATKERFDYLYPGYGKVLPVYHGAIGMLTEKGGHSKAGLSIAFNDHEDVTLRVRARDHFLTSMSYLETSAANRGAQLERFRAFFADTIEAGRTKPATALIRADNDPHALAEMFRVLAGHGVEVSTLDGPATITGLSLRTGDEVMALEVPAGTYIVRADQPMGRLMRVALEPDPALDDTDTYDITAWSLPIVFGLDGWWTDALVDAPSTGVDVFGTPPGAVVGGGSTAVVIDSDTLVYPRVIAAAIEHDVYGRVAGEPIEIDGAAFAPGSLILQNSRNAHTDLDAFIDAVVASGATVHTLDSTYADAGPSLGNNTNRRFKPPSIGLIRNRPVDGNSYGATWFMLDRVHELPHTAIEAGRISSSALDGFKVVLVPNSGSFDDGKTATLDTWVRSGGTLVCVGRAAHWADRALLGLEAEEEEEGDRPKPSELTFEERKQRGIDDRVNGALVRLDIDTTHPLASALDAHLGVIKRDSKPLLVDDSTSVIARYAGNLVLGGEMSARNAEKLAGMPAVTSHKRGGGRVICIADDATFRGFQGGPSRMLLNAILLGPSVP